MRERDRGFMTAIVTRLVAGCVRRAGAVIALFVLLGGLACAYVAGNFAIDTDTSKLLSPSLPWRQQDLALDKAFPGRTDQLLVVIDGATPEKADAAATALFDALSGKTGIIRSIERPGGGDFFARNGILFRSLKDVQEDAAQLVSAQPFLASLAADPTLRGVMSALSQATEGVRRDRATLESLRPALSGIADALERLDQGKDPAFSWQRIISGRAPGTQELRRFITLQAVLDFSDLEPGREVSDEIRRTARDLGLTEAHGVRVRLTGPVALADEEFATVADGAALNGAVTVAIVVAILFLALRQIRIIVPVLINLFVGLAITAAIGLALVGALNLISVAFAVLFVGLGVDFGIQFAVRYREERHRTDVAAQALPDAAAGLTNSLVLAAASIALAFYSFLPTAYRGLSELGLIAGTGMIVALVTTMTLLPALLAVFRPGGEKAEIGYAFLAPVDRFLERRRNWVVGTTFGLVVLGLPLLLHLRFDSNPLDLRSPKTESVATLLELLRDPDTGQNAIEILSPDLPQALALGERLRALPEVSRVATVQSFVPDEQEQKLAALEDANFFLQDTLNPEAVKPAPDEAETRQAVEKTARDLTDIATDRSENGVADARRLAALLKVIAAAPAERVRKAEAALVEPLLVTLDQTRNVLSAGEVTLDNLPETLRKHWLAADGRARVEVAPAGNTNDDTVLRRFVEAVQAVAPMATGAPVSFVESARTIVKAFLQAAALSVVAIACFLFLALRSWKDVALTLVPLLVAGIVTLEICVLVGLPMNFANIIALPLMLGVGVAFKVYYVMAWRAGQTDFLQSSLTRAVFFSACTTATAFGSLWLSHHPGTSSMGELLGIALMTTLCAAVLFQPALLATQGAHHR